MVLRRLLRTRIKLKFLFYVVLLFLLFTVLIENEISENLIVTRIHDNQLKAVQLITQRFYFPNWGLPELGRSPFQKCPETRCYAFQSHIFRNKPFEESDGILVHVPDLHYMPSRTSYQRNPKQLWLFYTIEPQTLSYCSHYYSIHQLDDWFNLTATFKPNSDVLISYREFTDFAHLHLYSSYLTKFTEIYSENEHFLADQLKAPKKRLALWMVSHCWTSSKRENYVRELQKHMKVDIYGLCNSKPDPCDNLSGEEKNKCLKNLFNSYKFFFAFENSNCDYYITEKYWQFYYTENFFTLNIVPVVRGARFEHYGGTTFGHPTFIFADNFDSPKSLADYLMYLDHNQTAYLEYFNWKTRVVDNFKETKLLIDTGNQSVHFLDRPYPGDLAPFCEICSKLHNRTYLNAPNNPSLKITQFFNPENDCRDSTDPFPLKTFFKNIIGKCV